MAEKYFLLSEIEKDFDWLKSRGSEDIQFRELIERLENGVIPAADVAQVVHGEWVASDNPHKVELVCSACGQKMPYVPEYLPNKPPYCNCGAKMDGGKHETD